MNRFALGTITSIGLMAAGTTAQAADMFFDYSINNGTFAGGGSMTGTFTLKMAMDGTFSYTAWDIDVDATALNNTTNPYNYVNGTSDYSPSPFPPNTSAVFTENDVPGGIRSLFLLFDTALDTLSVGDTANLTANPNPAFGSNDSWNSNGVTQIASVTGGFVRLEEKRNGTVPEPLTMLGAGAAAAFGVSFKRKLAKSK